MKTIINQIWQANIASKKMTQHAFAKKYGFSAGFVSQIRNGTTAVTHSFICALAIELNVNPLDIDPEFHNPIRFTKLPNF